MFIVCFFVSGAVAFLLVVVAVKGMAGGSHGNAGCFMRRRLPTRPVYMCIYIHIYIYVYMYVYIYIYIYTHTYIYIYVYIYIYIYVRRFNSLQAKHMHVHTHKTHRHTCKPAHPHVCI